MPRKKKAVLRSSFEDRLAAALDAEGIEYEYETKTFSYTVVHKYKPDFVLKKAKLLVEAKGYFTAADRSKCLAARPAIEAAGWELVFVFQRASNKLHRLSPTTYADWCDKHGFRWAEGEIPVAWIE